MHATAIKDEILQEHPWVANNLAQAFESAKIAAYRRMSNPRIVPLAWFLDEWDAQRELLGADPWEFGLTPSNRKNLETLIGYSKAGGLISNLGSVDEFYVDVMLDSRGRGEWAQG